MAQSSPILISTFGGLRTVCDDRVIDKFATRKGRTMLARLALSSRAILRSTLSEILWPDEYFEATKERLRSELYRLKGLGSPISDLLITTRESVDLDRSGFDLDVQVFDRQLQRAAASDSVDERLNCLQQALAIADGEWLAHETDEWFSSERQRVLVKQANAFISASEAAQELSEPGLTLSYAQACVQLLPHFTVGVERLIDVLESFGNISDAMLAYEFHFESVQKRFGGSPDPRLQMRIERIRTADRTELRAKVQPQATVELPVIPEGPPKVHGRDAEILRICRWLSPQSLEPKRLVCVIGPAGIGKSTVALAASKKLKSDFGGRVAFVDLTLATTGDEILEGIAKALLIHGSGNPLPRLRKSVGAEPLLFVLDNLEQIPDASSATDRLLDYLPGIRILATSRRPIRSNREQRLTLLPLLTSAELSNESEMPAVPLFLEHFRLRMPDYAPGSLAMEAIAKLVHRLNGHPLAIVLAASRGHVFSPEEMLAEVERGLNWIRTDVSVAKAEHRELAAAFGSTLGQLNDPVNLHFQELSLFEGEWTMADAKVLCGAGVVDSVSELVDCSLVRRLERGGESRYSIVLVFREFLRDQGLSHTGENLERLANWFMRTLRDAYSVRRTDSSEYMRRVDRIAQNFESVFGWTSEHFPALTTEMLAQLWFYWYEGNKGARYVNYLARWFSGQPRGEKPWIAEGISGLARINFEIGNLEDALVDCERAKQLFSELGDRRGEVSTYQTRMLVNHSRFDYAEILNLSNEAIKIADEFQDEDEEEGTWLSPRLLRAIALTNLGRGEEALVHLREIIAHLEFKGYKLAALRARRSLAISLISLRRWSEADALLRDLQCAFAKIENHRDRAICWQNMIIIALRTGQFEEAKRRLALADEYAKPIETDYFIGNRNYLGSLIAVHDRQHVLALERAMYVLGSWYRPEAEIGVLPAVDLVAFVLASFGDLQGARRLADGVVQARIQAGIEISPHFTCTQEDLFNLIAQVPSRPDVPTFDSISELVKEARRLAKISKSPFVASH